MSMLETLTEPDCSIKGQITQLYNILRENHEENSENKRLAWIQDTNMDIPVED